MDYDGRSLLSRTVSKGSYYGKRAREIDTYPGYGMPEFAAHMLWIVIEQCQQKQTNKANTLPEHAMTPARPPPGAATPPAALAWCGRVWGRLLMLASIGTVPA